MLTRFPYENRGEIPHVLFSTCACPEGRCKQTCLYNRVLISKDDSNIYLIRFTFEKDEDRGSAFFVVL